MITPEPPAVSPRGRYTTMQACAALGICRKTLYVYLAGSRVKPKRGKVRKALILYGTDIMKIWNYAQS